MVTISDATKRSNIYETVYDILTAATLLPSTTNVTVTASYIDDIQRLPQVVVYPVDISKGDHSIDWSNAVNDCMVTIEVYSKNAKHIDNIVDAIDALSSLKLINGLCLREWKEQEGIDTTLNNKIHLKTIVLIYSR